SPSRSLSSHVIVSAAHSSTVLLFFFNAPAPTEIYPLSLHDALPIYLRSDRWRRALHGGRLRNADARDLPAQRRHVRRAADAARRSEEHTSELQSPYDLVCRLLLEKKNKKKKK